MKEKGKSNAAKTAAAAPATASTAGREVVEHKGHTIIAGHLGGKSVAQVYLGQRMATKERFQGDSLEAVTDRARAWIDEKLETSARERRAPYVATEGEYRDALHSTTLSRFQKAMLTVHAQQETLSSEELARAAGYKTTKKALESYAAIGRSLGETLGLKMPDDHPDGAPAEIVVLAEPHEGGEPQWRMHPELASVVRSWE